jgi:hypothetical protein
MIFLIALFIYIIGMIILMIINKYSNNKIFCNILGWHKKPLRVETFNMGQSGECPRCKKKVFLNHNGDWFTI